MTIRDSHGDHDSWRVLQCCTREFRNQHFEESCRFVSVTKQDALAKFFTIRSPSPRRPAGFQNELARYVDKCLAKRSFSRLFLRVTRAGPPIWQRRAGDRLFRASPACSRSRTTTSSRWTRSNPAPTHLAIANGWRERAAKKKGPANRAFDEFRFLSVLTPAHLPSLAIWCVRRETLRLALFR